MWRSISSATTTRARDGSHIGLLYPWYRRHAGQGLEQLDRTLVQIDSV